MLEVGQPFSDYEAIVRVKAGCVERNGMSSSWHHGTAEATLDCLSADCFSYEQRYL